MYRKYQFITDLDAPSDPNAPVAETPALVAGCSMRRYAPGRQGKSRIECEISFDVDSSARNRPAFDIDFIDSVCGARGVRRYAEEKRQRLYKGLQLLAAVQAMFNLLRQSQVDLRTSLHEQLRGYYHGTRCFYPATGRCFELGDVSDGDEHDPLGKVIYHAVMLAPAAEVGQQILISEEELSAAEELGLVEILGPEDKLLVDPRLPLAGAFALAMLSTDDLGSSTSLGALVEWPRSEPLPNQAA